MGFRWNSRNLQRNVRDLDEKVDGQIRAIFDRQALRGAAYMKMNAPWTDRTGNARAGLYAQSRHDRNSHEIILSHSVAYGIWLEIANSGEYQIILPSVRVIGRETMELLERLFGDIR